MLECWRALAQTLPNYAITLIFHQSADCYSISSYASSGVLVAYIAMGKILLISLYGTLLATAFTQSTLTICEDYASTITFTAYQTFYNGAAGVFTSDIVLSNSTTQAFVSTIGAVILPDATITPLLNSSIVSTSAYTHGASTTSSISRLSSFTTQSDHSSTVQGTSGMSLSTSLTSQLSTLADISSSTITTSGLSVATSLTVGTFTLSTDSPIVTNDAYVSTVLKHHNVHRGNHSASFLAWSPALAETAKRIASTCVYGHNV